MMENIVRLRLSIALSFLLIFSSFCKSLPGPLYPKYKNQGSLNQIFLNTNKNQLSFYFDIYSQIYQENLIGELVLEEKTYIEKFENKNIKVSHLNFQIRALSKNHSNHIRLREYKGTLYFNEPFLDLHSQDCYTYAKKTYYDRFYVVEGWDCDHMIFLLKKENDTITFINKYNPELNKLENSKTRYYYTDWFLNKEIKISNLLIEKEWYGKFIDETQNHYIFYGSDANRFLKKDEVAYIYPENIQVKVTESIGDFIFIDKSFPLDMNQKDIFIYIRKKN